MLENQRMDGSSPSLKGGEDRMRCPSSNTGAEIKGSKFYLPLHFVLLRISMDWMILTPHWGGPFALFSPPIQMLFTQK
jgi:hypothetical protein